MAGPWVAGKRDAAAKYLSTALGAAEMVMKGCTACYDLVYEFPVPSVAGLDTIAQAYADVGMRAVVAPMIADRTFYDAIPGVYEALAPELQQAVAGFKLEPMEASIGASAQAIRTWRFPRDQVRPAIAPTIPLHCSEEFMRRCRRIADEHDIGLHMHVSESKVQAIAARKRYGKSLAAYICELGLVDERFTGAHAIWLDADDFKRIGDRGGALVHIPGSNFRLGSGLALVRGMPDAKVSVGIATDGATSSDNLNMFEAMRLASFVSRAHGLPHEQWLTSREVFRLATRGSATAAGLGDLCGQLAPGFKADIVFLDAGHINYLPLNDALNQVVNCEDGAAVEHVMIGGKMVVRNRKLQTLDLGKLRQRIEDTSRRILADTGALKATADRLSPEVAAFCRTLIREPHPFNRYAGALPGESPA